MKIKLTDGSVLELPAGTTVAGVAGAISDGLKRNAVAGKVNGHLVDLSYPVNEDAEVTVITLKDPEGLQIYARSGAGSQTHLSDLFARDRSYDRKRILLRRRLQDPHHAG